MLLTLKSPQQNTQARERLIQRGASALHLGLGDRFKSWDLELAINVLDQHMTPDSAILDIGAFASEMSASLCQLGYCNLYAVDLNEKILQQPMSDRIHYAVGNFYHTAAVSGSFDAITAISVIEHGYDPNTVFKEIARLLRPGGLFIASYDYWPTKVSTEQVLSFGMPWCIFSESEVKQMIQQAKNFGLYPLTEQCDLEADQYHIQYNGFNYTFGFAVFQRQ